MATLREDEAIEPLDRMLMRNRAPMPPEPSTPSYLPFRLQSMFRRPNLGHTTEPIADAPVESQDDGTGFTMLPFGRAQLAPWVRNLPSSIGRMFREAAPGYQAVGAAMAPGLIPIPEHDPFAPEPTAPGVMMGGRPAPEPPSGFDEARLRSDIGTSTPAAQTSQPPIPMRETPSEPAAPKPQMRAIRMPGGKLLFTNRSEIGGEEISTEDAGREVRAQDLSRPSLSTLTSLVRASARAAMDRGEDQGPPAPPVQGHMTPGEAPDMRPGVNFLQATPEQQTRLDMETALSAAALGEANQHAEAAAMPVAARAALENKDIQTGNWIQKTFGPKLAKTRADAQAAAEAINDPRSEFFIADEGARRARARQIATDLESATRDITATMAVIMKQRPPEF